MPGDNLDPHAMRQGSDALDGGPRTLGVPAASLRIAALTPFTTIDYPGKLSAVIFVQGCPWRCVYCQNAWMQTRELDPNEDHPSWDDVVRLLSRRRGLLDGVVFSGGEPCADPALPAAAKAVKAMGFLVGLHTGGAYPRRFKEVLPYLDWVGLDVKASPDSDAFDRITQRSGSAAAFLETFEALSASGVAFECRTTAHPDLHSEAQLLELAEWLKRRRIERFALQIYRKPPQSFLSVLAPVTPDYPTPAARQALQGAVGQYLERRD